MIDNDTTERYHQPLEIVYPAGLLVERGTMVHYKASLSMTPMAHMNPTNKKSLKIGIVMAGSTVPRLSALFSRAYEVLLERGVSADGIHTISIPSSYDIMTAARNLLMRETFDAILCLGFVPQGERGAAYPRESTLNGGAQWVAFYRGVPLVFSLLNPRDAVYTHPGERGEACATTALALATRFS